MLVHYAFQRPGAYRATPPPSLIRLACRLVITTEANSSHATSQMTPPTARFRAATARSSLREKQKDITPHARCRRLRYFTPPATSRSADARFLSAAPSHSRHGTIIARQLETNITARSRDSARGQSRRRYWEKSAYPRRFTPLKVRFR